MTFICILSYFRYFCTKNEEIMTENREKKERTVIHLHLLNTDEHHYFGSIANMYEYYDANALGITYGALRNYGLSNEKPYKNKQCVIRNI